MTHVLLWNGDANTLEVVSTDEMLARNRRAYVDDLYPCPVPLMAGSESDMRAAAESCSQTLLQRRVARTKAVEAIRRAQTLGTT